MQVEITGSAVDQDTIITVAELKSHLRVTHTQEDTLIGALRSAAISYVEEYCNIKLGSYTARGYLPGFYNAYIPIGPVTAISEVKYQTTQDKDYTTDLTPRATVDPKLTLTPPGVERVGVYRFLDAEVVAFEDGGKLVWRNNDPGPSPKCRCEEPAKAPKPSPPVMLRTYVWAYEWPVNEIP